MDIDFSDEEVDVQCSCGATWKVARTGTETDDFITCNVCGSRVKLHTMTMAPEPAGNTTTIFSAPSVPPVRDPKSKVAVELVREGKFDDAIAQYEDILSRQPTYRDVFYGLGYCFYKTAKLHEAQVLLRIADDMGHPNAQKLLTKALAMIAAEEGHAP